MKASVHSLGVLVGLAVWPAVSAYAQEATTTLEEVVVTAQRRAESLQRVPIVIHAISAEVAAERDVRNVQDLGNIAPGFQYNRSTNTGLVFLRGVGAATGAAGEEGPIAFYLDGVYVYSLNGNLFDLNNIERVEIAAGPQGTLFGRNALGGVLQVVTKDPQHDPALDMNVGYGNYSTVRGEMYGTMGLSDTLAADLSVLYNESSDGFGRNLATGQRVFVGDQTSVRTKWLWTPSDSTDVRFSVAFNQYHDDVGVSARLLPGSIGRDGITTAPANFYDVSENLFGRFYNRSRSSTLTIGHDFERARIVSISAYQDNWNAETNDADYSPATITHQDPVQISSDTWSQEFQLVSNPNSHIDWIAGLFFLQNESQYEPARIRSATTFFDIVTQLDTTSYAAYTQAALPLTDRDRLTLGVRYTSDRKEVKGGNVSATGAQLTYAEQDETFPKTTFRVSFDHSFTDAVLGYVSYNRGFKSGTFNSTAPADPVVRPQVIDAYEAGLKTELLDRRLRLNIGGFYYDYTDMQVRQVLGTANRLLNAAEARHYGVDLGLEAAIGEHLTLYGAAEWLSAEFSSFPNAPATQRNPAGGNVIIPTDLSGRDVFQAPALSGNVGVRYAMPTRVGEFLWGATYQYNDGYLWSAEVDDRTRQDSYGLVNASLQWTHPQGKWDIRLWGKNLADEQYNAFVNTSPSGDHGSPAPPRTYGVSFGAHF